MLLSIPLSYTAFNIDQTHFVIHNIVGRTKNQWLYPASSNRASERRMQPSYICILSVFCYLVVNSHDDTPLPSHTLILPSLLLQWYYSIELTAKLVLAANLSLKDVFLTPPRSTSYVRVIVMWASEHRSQRWIDLGICFVGSLSQPAISQRRGNYAERILFEFCMDIRWIKRNDVVGQARKFPFSEVVDF